MAFDVANLRLNFYLCKFLETVVSGWSRLVVAELAAAVVFDIVVMGRALAEGAVDDEMAVGHAGDAGHLV